MHVYFKLSFSGAFDRLIYCRNYFEQRGLEGCGFFGVLKFATLPAPRQKIFKRSKVFAIFDPLRPPSRHRGVWGKTVRVCSKPTVRNTIQINYVLDISRNEIDSYFARRFFLFENFYSKVD